MTKERFAPFALAVSVIGFIPFFMLIGYLRIPGEFCLPLLAVYALGAALLVMWLDGAAVKLRRWTTILGSIAVAALLVWGGVDAYIASIPTLDDRALTLYEYQPYAGEKTTQLPEKATLQFDQAQAESFTMDGATALYPVYASFVQAIYPEGEYPWWDFRDEGIALCNGTTEAYERLIAGETDVIFVAEPSKKQREAAAAAGLELHLTPIGRECFVFFVNSRNPVTGLTVKQVQGIYTGEITNWSQVGGENRAIRPYQRDEGSGSQTALQLVMAGLPLMEPETHHVSDGMGTIIQEVASYKNYANAIGYTFRFYANEMVANDQIRLLALNGVEPTKETIRDGSYPISSYFYAVTASPIGEAAPEKTNAALKAFLDWCQGEQGQWIVENVGYVSMK
ncbi:MAG: substrate-binding domain-containing protein [Clostridia bacterium]|nr:substrate-binding domain-containing protein [Clostridia bacterium]